MLWNWTTIDACFISSDWHVRSHGAFAGTCIGVVLMGVTLEALRRGAREYDQWIVRDFRSRLASATATARDDQTAMTRRTAVFRPRVTQQLIRAVLHAATFGVAYMLMLMAMYYNGYIILCIFLGAGVGKFLCDWMAVSVVVGDSAEDKLGGRTIDEPTVCCG